MSVFRGDFTVYDEHGRIRLVIGGSREEATRDVPEGGGLIRGTYEPDDYYIQSRKPRRRPDSPHSFSAHEVPADGESMVVIDALPAASEVSVAGPGTRYTTVVDDGVLELSFVRPGRYRVLVSPPHPYRLCGPVTIHAR